MGLGVGKREGEKFCWDVKTKEEIKEKEKDFLVYIILY